LAFWRLDIFSGLFGQRTLVHISLVVCQIYLQVGDGEYTLSVWSVSNRGLFQIPFMSKSLEHLLPPGWKTQITTWLTEDVPSFDYGGYVVGEAHREAFLFGKGHSAAILAGSPFFTEVFTQLGCESVSNQRHRCSADHPI
jgi:hypothetical protein